MTPEAKPLTMSAEQLEKCRKMAKAQMYGPGNGLLAELDAQTAAFALLQSQFDNLRRDKEQGDRQNALILADYRKEVGAHAETRYRLREIMLHAEQNSAAHRSTAAEVDLLESETREQRNTWAAEAGKLVIDKEQLTGQLAETRERLAATLAHFDNAFGLQMQSQLEVLERDHTFKMENRRLETESDEVRSDAALRAKPGVAETQMAWKPIKTAPLDRWILGADQDKWMRIKWQPRSAFWSGWPTYEPPTHWMIPDTPKPEATK
jgi:hypothetical protein